MEYIKKKYTPEEILNIVNSHIENGNINDARHLMTLTTNLKIKEKKEVANKLRDLKIEDITKTDLSNISKFGCSFSSAAILLITFSIIYNFFSNVTS